MSGDGPVINTLNPKLIKFDKFFDPFLTCSAGKYNKQAVDLIQIFL